MKTTILNRNHYNDLNPIVLTYVGNSSESSPMEV